MKVVGLPDLRAGQIVVIKELGARLSGKYFVTKTTHTDRRLRLPDVVQLPARVRAWTDDRVYGVVVGLVTDVDDPDRAGADQLPLPVVGRRGRRQRMGPDRQARWPARTAASTTCPRSTTRRSWPSSTGRRPPDGARLPAQRRRPAARPRHRPARPPAQDGVPATCSSSTTATARRASALHTNDGHQLELNDATADIELNTAGGHKIRHAGPARPDPACRPVRRHQDHDRRHPEPDRAEDDGRVTVTISDTGGVSVSAPAGPVEVTSLSAQVTASSSTARDGAADDDRRGACSTSTPAWRCSRESCSAPTLIASAGREPVLHARRREHLVRPPC